VQQDHPSHWHLWHLSCCPCCCLQAPLKLARHCDGAVIGALQSGQGQLAGQLLEDMAVLQQHISSRVDGATAAMLQVRLSQHQRAHCTQ
jgi:hypothetical protein